MVETASQDTIFLCVLCLVGPGTVSEMIVDTSSY